MSKKLEFAQQPRSSYAFFLQQFSVLVNQELPVLHEKDLHAKDASACTAAKAVICSLRQLRSG